MARVYGYPSYGIIKYPCTNPTSEKNLYNMWKTSSIISSRMLRYILDETHNSLPPTLHQSITLDDITRHKSITLDDTTVITLDDITVITLDDITVITVDDTTVPESITLDDTTVPESITLDDTTVPESSTLDDTTVPESITLDDTMGHKSNNILVVECVKLPTMEIILPHRKINLHGSFFHNGCVCGHKFEYRDIIYSTKNRPIKGMGVTIKPKTKAINARLRSGW